MVEQRSIFRLAIRSVVGKDQSRDGSKPRPCATERRVSLSRLADGTHRSVRRWTKDDLDRLRCRRLSDLRAVWLQAGGHQNRYHKAEIELSFERGPETLRAGREIRRHVCAGL